MYAGSLRRRGDEHRFVCGAMSLARCFVRSMFDMQHIFFWFFRSEHSAIAHAWCHGSGLSLMAFMNST